MLKTHTPKSTNNPNTFQSIFNFLSHLTKQSTTALFLFALVGFVHAENRVPYVKPPFPDTNAMSYVLMDSDSKQVLAEKGADEIRHPASLTKIMTSFVALSEIRAGNISLTDEVLISENAWKTGGSRSFIKVNTKIDLETLLKAMIVQSGNDSAVAIAEHVAGDEATFAQLMNLYAKKLGLTNTQFANASGLPDEKEYTSARDMAILAAALINQFPTFYKWHSIKELEINGIKQYNRNRLLWKDNEVDGMKTGHTTEAGYNLIASAVRDDMRLIAVVMKSSSPTDRETDAYKLLNYGFRFFKTTRVFEPETPIFNAKVPGFETDIPVGVNNSVYITIGQNRDELLTYDYQIIPNLKAPMKKGAQVGEVLVRFNDEIIRSENLFALSDVRKASVMKSVINWFKSFF